MFFIGPHKIENPYILAPMAGVSQMPFRRIALRLGAGLAPTELISAKGLFHENMRTKSYLTYDKKIERPFCVQLFGGEEESMANAAVKAQEIGAEIIDINMGCPVKKVTKTNAGSALMCDVSRAARIVRQMRKSTNESIPITVKIRLGWDQANENFIDVGKCLQDEGIAAIAMHARTRAQGYSGKADWRKIKELKNALSIPVIGNGDVKNLSDARNMFEQTGCDAVMVGRAALGNPWVFSELARRKKIIVSKSERRDLVCEHFSDHMQLQKDIASMQSAKFQNNFEQAGVKSFRSHLIWYSKGLSGGAKFRERAMRCDDLPSCKELIDEYFLEAECSALLHDNQECDGIDYRQAFG